MYFNDCLYCYAVNMDNNEGLSQKKNRHKSIVPQIQVKIRKLACEKDIYIYIGKMTQ